MTHAGENTEQQLEDMVVDLEEDLVEMLAGAHMLHEQAHGPVPWVSCQLDPCVHIYRTELTRGPARITLLGVGRD